MGASCNRKSQAMTDEHRSPAAEDSTVNVELSFDARKRMHGAISRFENAWRTHLESGGPVPTISDFLVASSPDERMALFRELLDVDIFMREKAGDFRPTYEKLFPEYAGLIRRCVGASPDVQNLGDGDESAGVQTISADYKVESELGRGAFGTVYLATEAGSGRKVAIKVPNPKRDLQFFLREVKTLSKLKHPNILPLLHVPNLESGRIYFVSEYIDGGGLDKKLKKSRLPYSVSARIVQSIATALAYAHQEGREVYHRDIKPANILLSSDGTALLADFGMALTDEDYGRLACRTGTIAYMSPEQVRYESNLVDGRSDVFSLGVVLYEMLTGQRPFRGTAEEVAENIKHLDPKVPREYAVDIPRELERICLKCLEKRRADRYIALELAQELDDFLSSPKLAKPSAPESPAPRIVRPKGIRAFDGDDAEFFLELLPGPRDRNGLPDSLRFWKTRIETVEATFSVGLISGPSGCGKSSLVSAGLVPRLSEIVRPIVLEVKPHDTAQRLNEMVAAAVPDLPRTDTLAELLLAVRTTDALPKGQKLLIVLDQFEQWLNANRNLETSELVNALRQCDGKRLQSLLLVRSDFQMAAGRFLNAIEVSIVEGENFAAVDLFSPSHAKNVLKMLGRAVGEIPMADADVTVDQHQFLETVTEQLEERDGVTCVRLAMFAETMRNRPWTMQRLSELGGADGIGEKFLDEKFGSKNSVPEYRQHVESVILVLKMLLPPPGDDIRGQARTSSELLLALDGRVEELRIVTSILDRQLRLITPTDNSEAASASVEEAGRFQLTHDFLVPAIRNWIHYKQQLTRRGRAEQCLQERTTQWIRVPESRFLPTLLEHARILAYVPSRQRAPAQRKMLAAAAKRHMTIVGVAIGIIGLAAWWNAYNREKSGQQGARAVVESLLTAIPDRLPRIVETRLPKWRRWAVPMLEKIATSEKSDERRLRARVALIDSHPEFVKPVVEDLYTCSDEMFPIVRESLVPFTAKIANDVWRELRNDGAYENARFRAALALAGLVGDCEEWTEDDLGIALSGLLDGDLTEQSTTRLYLGPIGRRLRDFAIGRLEAENLPKSQQLAVSHAIAAWSAGDPYSLARALGAIDPSNFEVIFNQVVNSLADGNRKSTVEVLVRVVGDQAEDSSRRVNACAALLRLKELDNMALFFTKDSAAETTEFVRKCRQLGVSVDNLVDCAREGFKQGEMDVVYGALLSLGEFSLSEAELKRRAEFAKQLAVACRSQRDSGVRAAASWLLRSWGLEEQVATIEKQQVTVGGLPDREWFTISLLPDENHELRQTFVVFAPDEFDMGSPTSESMHDRDEKLHRVVRTRAIAVAENEVTVEQWIQFSRATGILCPFDQEPRPRGDTAVNAVDWYAAVEFCRWLTLLSGMTESEQCYESPSDLDGDDLIALKIGDATRNVPKTWPCDPTKPGFRLLTEAEWEEVCRAGTRTAFAFGDNPDDAEHFGWIDTNSKGRCQRVRQLRPNRRGLFDMHGNLLEWCQDVYSSNLPSAVDPVVSNGDGLRVIRGGSMNLQREVARSAQRFRHDPEKQTRSIGFRIARTLK